ncbi:MAG: hypothetical protein R3C99_10970 [Pirellulaceae bacterium]
MTAFYWVLVWILMLTAFTAAWTFIVLGCEALDEAHPGESDHE